jgi:hypothetical protein
MCAGVIDSQDIIPLGYTFYHEMIHMVSTVRDINGAYSKVGAHTLAVNTATDARNNANNYMLYAAQNGLEHIEYLKATSDWGTFVVSPSCKD